MDWRQEDQEGREPEVDLVVSGWRSFSWALLASLVLAAGCAGPKSQQHYDQMRSMLVQGRYDDAVAFIEKDKTTFYGENNAVLFYLDKLMALHLAKKYQDSNQLIEQAQQKMDDLYTKSVSKEAGAALTNDTALPYLGEDFERALVHVVGALNYAFLGERDESEVEARRVEEQLQLLADAHEKEQAKADEKNAGKDPAKADKAAKKAVYSEDAFVRWFSGALHESDGSDESYNDAWISYKKALDAYEKAYLPKYHTAVPTVLVQDALRVSERLGFDDEHDAIKKTYPNVKYTKQKDIQNSGGLVFLHLNGEAPYKYEKTWEAYSPDHSGIKVAYPDFQSKRKEVAYGVLTVAGQTARTEPMEDIDAIAVANLKDHMGRVKGRMIARAIAKFIAAQVAAKATSAATGSGTLGWLAGKGASVAGNATEHADVRSWLLLPASIDATRMFLAPGTYKASVQLFGHGGQVVGSKEIPEFKVEKGHTTFVALRTF